MDSKTKTPFQLFIFPEAMMSEVVFVTICLDFCAHFFFGVPHIILIFCDQCLMVQVATVHKFSCVFFCFFSSFSFPPPVFHCCAGEQCPGLLFVFFLHFFYVSPTHLCSIVVQVAEISAAQFLPKVKLPRIHFALVSNFLKRSLFSTLSRKTL